MLLTISHQGLQPAASGRQYFEVLKEKAPELVIPFDDIQVVGRAYGDIGEHERAYLVWRATTEASYLEDARVGEVLRQRGRTLEAIAYLLDLWREYPDHGVDRERLLRPVAGPGRASPARPRPTRRSARELADAGGDAVRPAPAGDPARPGLPRASRPKNPLADEASLALVGAFLELEDFAGRREALAAVRRALPQEHVPRQLPVLRGPRPVPPRRVRPRDRGGRDDRQGDVQGRQRRRPAEPEQVAGPLHPRPDLRRPPPARARRWTTTSRSPTGSPTPPAPSRRSPARS